MQKRYQNLTFEGRVSISEVMETIFYSAPAEKRQKAVRYWRWNYRTYLSEYDNGHYRLSGRVENWSYPTDKANVKVAVVHLNGRTEVFYTCSCENFQNTGKVCKHMLVVLRQWLGILY